MGYLPGPHRQLGVSGATFDATFALPHGTQLHSTQLASWGNAKAAKWRSSRRISAGVCPPTCAPDAPPLPPCLPVQISSAARRLAESQAESRGEHRGDMQAFRGPGTPLAGMSAAAALSS
jgi:hypothetical protein